MSKTLPTLVAGALTNVRNPRLDKDVISAGMIRDLEVSPDGKVSLTLVLNQDDPPGLARETRQAIAAVEGVTDVDMSVMADVHPDEAPASISSSAASD